MQIRYILFCCITLTTYPLRILPPHELHKLGNKIRSNECGNSAVALVFWKHGEQWASIGIGHFIWYPAGYTDRYTETFPAVLTYLHNHGVALPHWLYNKKPQPCPWTSRTDFYNHTNSKQILELRKLLENTQDLQAAFIVENFNAQLQEMLHTLPAHKRKTITHIIEHISANAQGMFALIDYTNCKGMGTNLNERYKGQGWGLLQVVENMNNSSQDSLASFVQQAKKILAQRVRNAPAERNEQQWLAGWHNRINRYMQ